MKNKHAVLIICHSQPSVIEKTVRILDNERIDFYILVDKKSEIADFEFLSDIPKKSSLRFTDRISVNWGGDSQIKAEIKLLEESLSDDYRYYHLISGADLPLKRADEILAIFDENDGMEFLHYSEEEFSKSSEIRVKYYYPFQNSVRFGRNEKLKNMMIKIQKLFGVSRIKNDEKFYLGSNWFSITDDLARFILQNKEHILKKYKSTLCCDEVFLQTLVRKSPFADNIFQFEKNDYIGSNLRYIDWKRGNPYVFDKSDVDELLASKAIFARKFSIHEHPEAISYLYDKLMIMEK